MSREPGPVAKTFAVVGALFIVWFLVAAVTGLPGPWGMNR